MKIYGPMHALNSPIVLGALGLHALDSIVGLYHEYAQGQQNDILVKSALSGQPITSEPGGPIRHALSAITGGLVNPDVQATPQTLLGERAYQGAQQKAQIENAKNIYDIRAKGGPGAFAPGGPLASMATSAGIPADTLAQPTLAERQETNRETTEKRKADQSTVDYQSKVAAGKKQAELNTTYDPANVSRAIGLKASEERTAAGIREGAALDTHNREMAGNVDNAYNMAMARERAKTDAINATPIKSYSLKTGTKFYDRNTLAEVGSGTVGDAANNKDVISAPKGKAQEQIEDSRAAIARLEALDPLIDKVFPDTHLMNTAAANAVLLKKGGDNFARKTIDPDVSKFYQAKLDAVDIVKRINGRFPNQKELDIPLLPEPGDVSSKFGSSLVGTLFGGKRSDNREVAHAKLRDAINRLKGYTVQSIAPESAPDDDTDVGDAIDSAAGATP